MMWSYPPAGNNHLLPRLILLLLYRWLRCCVVGCFEPVKNVVVVCSCPCGSLLFYCMLDTRYVNASNRRRDVSYTIYSPPPANIGPTRLSKAIWGVSNIPPIPQAIVGREEAFRYCEQLDKVVSRGMKLRILVQEIILRSYCCYRLIQCLSSSRCSQSVGLIFAGINHPWKASKEASS